MLSIFLQSRWECHTQLSQRSRPVVLKWLRINTFSSNTNETVDDTIDSGKFAQITGQEWERKKMEVTMGDAMYMERTVLVWNVDIKLTRYCQLDENSAATKLMQRLTKFWKRINVADMKRLKFRKFNLCQGERDKEAVFAEGRL